MLKRNDSPGRVESGSTYSGRVRELWTLNGWRHPFRFLHAVFYLKNTPLYVNALASTYEFIQRKMPRSWYRWGPFKAFLRYFPDRYHGKVLSHENARKIIELNEDIRVASEKAERVLTFEQVNQIVMKNPSSIALADCACRKRKEDHCEPIHVCMFVGEPFASFVVNRGRKEINAHYITRDEALEILRTAHEAGFIHNAFFKDVFGDRLFAICNCCTCCCGVMNIQKDFNDIYAGLSNPPRMLLSSGYRAVYNQDKCTFCGKCEEACPFNAVNISDGMIDLNPGKCFGCGVCVDKCPEGAIKLTEVHSGTIPLDVDTLRD